MYGLYDIDGILRFAGSDKEACLAYAELLEISSDEYSLMDLPGLSPLGVKDLKRDHRHPARSNN